MLEAMIVFLLFVYGLIIGSFLNALVWRLRKKRDWVRERSECTHCHHVLAAKDLIPVLSWVSLGGKCRYCHKKIDDSPLSELGLGLLFAGSYLWWPYTLSNFGGVALFTLWLVVLAVFIVLCIYDFKWFLLPDTFTYGLLPLSIVFVILRSTVTPTSSIFSSLIGGAVLFGTFYALYQFSKGKWIGGGDVKIAFSLGLLAGSPGAAFVLIFLSSLLGTLFALPAMLKKKQVAHLTIPYGPFLILATVLSVLFYGHIYAFLFAPLFVSV